MPPKKPLVPVEPITARVSLEAAHRLRVAAAMEGLTTGQLIDRLILSNLPVVPELGKPARPRGGKPRSVESLESKKPRKSAKPKV